MHESTGEAVERVIKYIGENLGRQITIDEMARTAMFSKFYFVRLFLRVTGVTPGRFLSAMRLQEAKRLLESTTLPVAVISHRVGYASVGTFSTRFRSSVGVCPTQYRRQGGRASMIPGDRGPGIGSATVHGQILSPPDGPRGLIFVGLFRDRLAHGRPFRYVVRREPGAFALEHVPPGVFHLLAHAGPADEDLVVDGRLNKASPDTFVAVHGPITIRPGMDVRLPDLWLRPRSIIDPPILLARLDHRGAAALTRENSIDHDMAGVAA